MLACKRREGIAPRGARSVSPARRVMVTLSESEIAVDIRTAKARQLDLLEERFSPGSRSRYHYRRFAVQQRDEGVYLIAWLDREPVGHFLLRWRGPDVDPTGRYQMGTPYLEAGATRPEFQRRGIATRLVLEAERIVRDRGGRQIGLAVGSTDNPGARRLYERLGYRDWGQGEFVISWDYETADGLRGTESEICTYLLKTL